MELPDDLMREIKLRAVAEGRKLKEKMEALLRSALANEEPPLEKARIEKDEYGFPVIVNAKAPKVHTLTPERISEILLEQEDERYRNSA